MSGIIQKVLEVPARSPPVPSGNGEYVLYTESTHSFAEHKSAARVLILHVSSGTITEVPFESTDSSFKWIEPEAELIWQRRIGDSTELWTCKADSVHESYSIGSLKSTAVLHQATRLASGDVGLLLYLTEIVGEDSAWPHSSGKVFSGLPNVTFDQGIGTVRYSLLFASASTSTDKYNLPSQSAIDVLAGSDLAFFPYSGAMPNISVPNCTIAPTGIAFMAQKKGVQPIGRFSSETYFVPLPKDGTQVFSEPVHIPTSTCDGWAGLPAFSRDGRSLAFLREEDSRKLLIHRSIFVVRDVQTTLTSEMLLLKDKEGNTSSLYPESLQWSSDAKALYFPAVDVNRQWLYRVSLDIHGAVPTITAPRPGDIGSVMSATFATDTGKDDICFMSTSSFTTSATMSTLNLTTNSLAHLPGLEGTQVSTSQASEVWVEHEGRQVRMVVVRPSDFDKAKKYPVIMLVHGGPFAAWADCFISRFSCAVFAEQGYICVMPDFTGSVGYTRGFRDAVYGEIGGKPYRDLEACMDFIAEKLPYADIDRAVCLGGSFGGYMILWLAGQPLGKRFKALIAHAPSFFGTTVMHASDIPEIWMKVNASTAGDVDFADMSGTLTRWDPSRFAHNWETPLLLTHGARDNRCPVAVSLAAFAHCQMKGVESRLLVFPDESHFVLKTENALHWYHEVTTWMDRFAKA